MIGTRGVGEQVYEPASKAGYVTYRGRIHVDKSVLNVVLLDKLPDQQSKRSVLLDPKLVPHLKTKPTKIA